MDKSGNTLTALQVTLWPPGASGEDKTAHTSVPLTPHKAFRKLAAMHLNRYIIIRLSLQSLWSGGGACAVCGVGAGPRPLSPDDPGQLTP